MLTDLLAHALQRTAAVKQELLAEPRVDRRAEVLLEILRKAPFPPPETAGGSTAFPPPFSTN